MREDNNTRSGLSNTLSSPAHDAGRCHLSVSSAAELPRLSSTIEGEDRSRERTIRKRSAMGFNTRTALLSILATAPAAMAQQCVSLAGSTQCSAFNTSSITTNSTLVGFFPFLKYVSDTASFDQQLASYISTSYVQQKYQDLLGCDNVNLLNTTNLYARFTTTVICNAIIQNSLGACGPVPADSRPVCAQTCAQYAQSEEIILADNSLCSNPSSDAKSLIRADFTRCALPGNSLSGVCIEGSINEPNNCGFADSTIGFCQYCAEGGQNSTDTCCYNSDAEKRCAGVVLPKITGITSFSTGVPTASSISSATPSASSTPAKPASGLSGGAIAGIVVGAVAGVALLFGLIVLLVICLRRRRGGSQSGSVFNQPTPARKGQSGMAYNPVAATQQTPAGYEVLPGGRIARMSALEGHSGDSPPRDGIGSGRGGTPAGYAAGRRRHHEQSSSDDYSPESISNGGVLRPPPTGRRTGSLSSNSILGEIDPQSPHSGSGDGMSSPLGMTSQQSEQLAFFKDYYSQDEIHPGDKVATLWAYQPRAGDEFALERGDMLKVVGIWDDGWATGVLIDEKADDWEAKRSAQRDSGVSNTSGRRASPVASGEIKAFPLVCVCLPDHWKKTIEGDGSTETGSSGLAQHPNP